MTIAKYFATCMTCRKKNPIPMVTSKFAIILLSHESTTVILGDSMLKNIAAWRLHKRMKRKDHLLIHSFPDARISNMTSYCIPSVNKAPDSIISHCGTNDLNSKMSEVGNSTELITLTH